jgi:hypothetical protein
MTKTEQLSVALSLSLESENSFHFLCKVKTSQPAPKLFKETAQHFRGSFLHRRAGEEV